MYTGKPLSVPNACRYPIHAFGTLRASVDTCIIEIFVKILTASVSRMRVVTLYTCHYIDARWGLPKTLKNVTPRDCCIGDFCDWQKLMPVI